MQLGPYLRSSVQLLLFLLKDLVVVLVLLKFLLAAVEQQLPEVHAEPRFIRGGDFELGGRGGGGVNMPSSGPSFSESLQEQLSGRHSRLMNVEKVCSKTISKVLSLA